MITVETWSEAVSSSLINLWTGFINFLPNLIGAIVIFVVGWIISVALGKLVARILKVVKVDQGFERLGLKKGFKKAGVEFNIAKIGGGTVKWFFIIVFLMAATDILGLVKVTDFLVKVLLYIPNIIVAVIILAVAVLLADVLRKLVFGVAKGGGFKSARFLGAVTKWAVLIFAFLAVLVQLGIAKSLIQTLFTAFVAMVAIAGGLAFGLGGKDLARDTLEKLRESVSEEKE